MTLSTITTAYTITDGEDFAVWGGYHARTWATRAEAEAAMRDLCWHPKRYAGAFRVEPVQVECSRWGTVLEVRRSA